MIWFWRILLFPLWIFFILRRRERERQTNAPIVITKPKRNWELVLFDESGLEYDRKTARMVDEEEGLVIYGGFEILDHVKIRSCHVVWRNQVLSRKAISYDLTPGDFFKVRHALRIVKPAPEYKWRGKLITELDDKHLYNIVKGIERGHWANGSLVNVEPKLAGALIGEYKSRNLNHEDEVEIERQNMEWERNNLEYGYFDCLRLQTPSSY